MPARKCMYYNLLTILIVCFSFASVCKVGTGYSDSELKNLQKSLEKHWHVFKPQAPPQCIHLASSIKDKPDVWIEPKQYANLFFFMLCCM